MPRTSKPKCHKLEDVVRAELKAAKPLQLEAGDTVFEVPRPLFWPDDVYRVDDVSSAKMLLGDQYDDWCKAEVEVDGTTYKGNAKLLFRLIALAEGADRPES